MDSRGPSIRSTRCPANAGKSILVVEDDLQLGELFQTVLEGVGCKVSLAVDGQAALDIFRRALGVGEPFDLVLMDLNLPVMDGRQCLGRLLLLDPTVPILITTGDPDEEFASLEHLVAGVLEKPIGLSELMREVSRALGQELTICPPSPRRPTLEQAG